jgi:hypothetical protein
MKRLLFAAVFIQASFLCPKYHVKKIWLFSKIQYSGNVPRAAGGKVAAGSRNMLLCFAEVSKNEQTPDWQSARFKGGSYSVSTSPEALDSVAVGTDKNTRKPIIIKADADCKLIELKLTFASGDQNQTDESFALEGTFNKKHAVLKSADPVVELSPVFMP